MRRWTVAGREAGMPAGRCSRAQDQSDQQYQYQQYQYQYQQYQYQQRLTS
jgi:hypothetical protein